MKLISDKVALATTSVFELVLIQHIKDEQFMDPKFVKIRDNIADKPDFQMVDGVLYFEDRLCSGNKKYEDSNYD